MNQSKHRHQRHHFEHKGANSDIGILLQCFIQPLHANGGEEDGQAAHQVQNPLLPHPGNHLYRNRQYRIRHYHHHQIDNQQLVGCLTQQALVIPNLGTGPDTIGRDTQLGNHQKNTDCCGSSVDLSRSVFQQNTGNIRETNQRKDECRHVEDGIHHHIQFQRLFLRHDNKTSSAGITGFSVSFSNH